MKKVILLAIFFLSSFAVLSQNRLLYYGGPSISLPARSQTSLGPGVCDENYRGYYYQSPVAPGAPTNVLADPGCCPGYFDVRRAEASFTIGSGTVGSWTFTDNSYDVTWDWFFDENGSWCGQIVTQNTPTDIVITIVDMQWTNTGGISEMCLNEGAINLNSYMTYTTGVSYSGPGVSGSTFTPGNAGVGTHNIVATRNFDNGSLGRTLQITVRELPNVAIDLPSGVCNDATSYSLPSYASNYATFGGSFSGPGVSGTFFIPNSTGTGNKTITYTSGVNAYGCNAVVQDVVTVVADYTAGAGSAQNVCQGQNINLTGGSPGGGTWSGTGVSGGVFSSSGLSAGGYTVTYTVNQGGCVRAANKTVTVNGLPSVEAGSNFAACGNVSNVDLFQGGVSPAGGTWSSSNGTVAARINNGNGTLNANGIPAGNYTLTYTYSNGTCQNSDTRTITINAPPAVNAGGNQTVCQNGGTVALTGASPAGGSWSGTGVSGSTFDPVTAGVGTHTLTYSYSDGQCSNSATKQITVNTAGSINAGSDQAACVDTGNLTLTGGTPAGGTWSGTGVSGNLFNTGVGAGSYTVTYTATSNGCVGSDTKTVTINPRPTVEAGNNLIVCSNDAAFTLSGNSPSGGSWTGPGLTGPSQFSPSSAGAGMHTLTYTYTNGNGCTNTDTRTITVNTPTPVSIGTDRTFCANSAAYNLNSDVAPAFQGGSWSGNGVSGINFNPSGVTTGAHIITYTYTNANGCVSTQTKQFTVVPGPSVDAGPTLEVCLNQGLTNLVGESPSGGTWSGFGVEGNQFNPATSGTGIFVVTYSVTNSTCTVSDTRQVVVNTVTVVDAGANMSVCSNAADFLITGASLNGGVWNGPGVAGGYFSPSGAGVGIHTVSYTYTNAKGCESTDTRLITVSAAPNVNAGPDIQLCSNASVYNLIADVNVTGGSFSGPGVQILNFNPAVAGIGVHQVNYTYTDPVTTCSRTDFRYITVIAPQTVTIGGNQTVCIDTAPFALVGASIMGGAYSGNGVSGGTFSPAIAGVGNHVITYTVTDANGCNAIGTKTISVIALPVVEAGPDLFVCSGTPLVSLNGTGTPVGGTFSGTYVSGGNFDVAASGSGTFQVTYTYTNANGCTNADTKNIVVDAGATVNAGADFAVCVGSPLVDLASRVSPGGGSFVGSGVNGTNFNPSVGPGSYTITYSLANSYGCSGSDSFVITVNALPTVNAGSTKSLCFNEPSYDLSLTSVPSGGAFQGPGVNGNLFNPSSAGVGTHTIYYTYTNGSGCSNTATRTITVTDLPAVNAGNNLFMCVNSNLIDLNTGVTPTNGSWTGPGVTNGIFNPSSAGVGTHTTRYTITQTNGCSNYDERVITVFAQLVVDAGPNLTVCSNAPVVSLTNGANVSGGTWTGTSVAGTNFTPSVGPGTYQVSLSYTDFYGCSATDSKTITVISPQSVSVGSDLTMCVTGTQVDLSASASPFGGAFSGTGITGTNFNPTLAGIGTHPINYTVVDALGCTTTKTRTMTVTAPPAVDAGANKVVCLSNGLVDLDAGASVTGGTWSGNSAVSGSFFNPVTAGVGTYVVNYTYNNGQGCISTDTKSITVRSDPTVEAGNSLTFCVNATPFDLATQPDKGGGVWTGVGLTGSVFNPATAGVGNHSLVYRYTDAFGCIAQDTKSIFVNDKPSVSAGSPATLCTTANAINLNSGVFPAGGSWTGAGITGTFFNPQTVGTGAYPLSYQVTDGNGCSNTAVKIITVALPSAIDTGPNKTICVGNGLLDLDLSSGVSGGVWTGLAVSNNQFDPVTAGVGNHLLTYTYNDGQGCISVDTKTVIVRNDPVLNAGPDLSLCVNSNQVNLNTQVNLNGGVWTGLGITSGSVFNPSTAGAGVHNLKYNFTDSYGCSVADYINVDVNTLPIVDGGPTITVCNTAPSVNLSPSAFPAGGSWLGAGVIGNSFDPSTVGLGQYDLVYTFTTGEGCSGTDTKRIVVIQPETITVGGNLIVCENSPRIDLASLPSKLGGAWAGTGLDGNYFNPVLAGIGTHNLTYTYDNGSGCISIAQKTIQVKSNLSVEIGSDLTRCVNGSVYNLSVDANVSGGTWSGFGVSGTNFNPASAGVGVHLITYQINDEFGCKAQDTKNILVTDVTSVDAGPPATICTTATPLNLVNAVSTSGGLFSGPGISGNTFVPTNTGTGTFDITYTFSNANSCLTSDVRKITVVTPETISIGGNQILCVNSPRIDLDLGVSKVGGSWSGSSGLEGSFFNPALAGVGTYTITYTYSGAGGCVSVASKTIQVRAAITVDAGINKAFCRNAGVYSLTNDASILGGSWSGPGVSGSNFSASSAGVGTHILTYVYHDEFGCTASDTRTFTVADVISVNAGPDISVCTQAAAFDLSSSGFPSGGVWTGQGITGSNFDPATVGVGSYLITYLYADVNGCTGSDTKQITVSNPPVVDAGANFEICVNAAPITLAGASPVNGTWSGTGIIAGIFDPLSAGLGMHNLTYSFTDLNGCTKTDQISVSVIAEPTLTIGGDIAICKNASPLSLLTDASIKGGTFAGKGMTGAIFNSKDAGAGTHVITYTVRFNGCELVAFRNITVNEAEILEIGSNMTVCVQSNSYDLIKDVNVVGGTFSGAGMTDSEFKPSDAGVGSHVITYSYTNAFGCVSSDFRVITVQDQLPIDAGDDITLCNSVGSYDLNGRGVPEDGIFVGSGIVNNVFNPTVTGLGTFQVEYVVDNGNGCVSRDQMQIIVKPSTINNFGLDSIVCITAKSVPLNFSSELANGQWNGKGAVANVFYPSLAGIGTHNLTYTNQTLDCDVVGKRVITVVGLPKDAISEQRNMTACEGTFVTLKAQVSEDDRINNVSVAWYLEDDEEPFETSEEIFYQVNGTKKVYYKAIDQYGCTSGQKDYVNVQTNNPTAQITVSEPKIAFAKSVQYIPVQVKNAEKFEWDFGDGLLSFEKSPWHYYYQSGQFDVTLKLTSAGGCVSTIKAEKILEVLPEAGRDQLVAGLGDERSEMSSLVTYYPNPHEDELRVQIKSAHTLYYDVIAVSAIGVSHPLGKHLLQEGDNEIILNTAALASGVYFIRITSAADSFTLKSIKK